MPYKRRSIDGVDLEKPYLTTLEAASILHTSPETLRRRNKRGVGPFPAHEFCSPILYRTADVIGDPNK